MIRYAQKKDIPRLGELLCQVDLIHHGGRPDIFKVGRKYSDAELGEMLFRERAPILVATDENDVVQGYCFCILQQHTDSAVLTDIKTLYIDDLCVDESCRGKGIGKLLYDAALALAKEMGCYNVTLNVWACNPSAMRFYEKCGMAPQKTYMETLL